jgi:hypothetical protein
VQQGSCTTRSGRKIAAAAAAVSKCAYTTHTGGAEGMQRMVARGGVLELRGGRTAGPARDNESCNALQPGAVCDAFSPWSRSTMTRGDDSDEMIPDSEADDAADMVIASDAALQLMPATQGISYDERWKVSAGLEMKQL